MGLISARKLERAINSLLLESLGREGFVQSVAGGVERWSEDRYDYIACNVSRSRYGHKIVPFGQMGFAPVQKIFSYFIMGWSDEPLELAVNLALRYGHFVRDWNEGLYIYDESEIDGFLNLLHGFVVDQLYPALMKFDSPKKVIDAYASGDESVRDSFDIPVWYDCWSAAILLILARLYDPGRYGELKARYAAQFFDLDEENLKRVEQLFSYLEQPGELPTLPVAN